MPANNSLARGRTIAARAGARHLRMQGLTHIDGMPGGSGGYTLPGNRDRQRALALRTDRLLACLACRTLQGLAAGKTAEPKPGVIG